MGKAKQGSFASSVHEENDKGRAQEYPAGGKRSCAFSRLAFPTRSSSFCFWILKASQRVSL